MNSSLGSDVASTLGARYSADMQPQPITETQVPRKPIGNRRGSVGTRSEVISESIFGNFVYSSDQVPQRVNPSWTVGPDKPAPISGFGEALVPTTEFVPATDHWGGHGIFGGRMHHGGYGVNRYGEPIHGFGDVGEWHPNAANVCCPSLTDMTMHGYYSEDDPHERANMIKYHFPPGSCTALITKGKWPAEWACNLPNTMLVAAVFRKAQEQMSGTTFASSGDYIDAIRAGKVPAPPGFPALYKGPAPPPPAPPAQVVAQVAAQADAAATGGSNTALFVGIGIAALALIGGGLLLATRPKATAA